MAMLVSPWCSNGDLAKYVLTNSQLTRDEKLKLVSKSMFRIVSIAQRSCLSLMGKFCGAARGLSYLHSRDPPIFHGDIKPQNVIIQDNLEAALCDFGISKVILDADKHCGLTTRNICSGTSGYQSKEILNDGPPTTAADVYAFGGLILAVRLISYLLEEVIHSIPLVTM